MKENNHKGKTGLPAKESEENRRMKKIITGIFALTLAVLLAACGEKNESYEIPDVFGVNYEDAIAILEEEGFSVSAVEAEAESFSQKLLYPLERVDKGSVFKIDEYILDNNGNLNKSYDVFYEEGLTSPDKNLVIYYAKEDYVREETATQPETETTAPPTETQPPETTQETAPTGEAQEIDSEFKAAMDSYEKFFDEYVAIMKKYQENPNDLSILTDYAAYVGQYADMMQKLEKWENEDLNAAEAAYYVEVQTRINQKLLEIA